jgi:glycosyltransferase involved in cell wall biosynthesis
MDTMKVKAGEAAPAVSIGLAVYNGAPYLRQTLDSLLAQTLTDFELIICDNASTDQTSEVCREYAARDNRIRYYRNDANIGSVLNHRRALDLARGKYFRWASANDLCRPQLLEKCAEVLDTQPDVVVAFGLTTLIDRNGEVIAENNQHLHLLDERPSVRFINYLTQIGLINQFAGLIRTEAMRRVRPLGDYIGSDIIMLAELALAGKVFEIRESLFMRRMSKDAATSYRSLDELKKFYHPGHADRVAMPVWRQQCELYRAIWRSHVPLGDKFRSSWFVSKCFYWRRRTLSGELRGAVLQMGRHIEEPPAGAISTEKKTTTGVNSSSPSPKR